MTAAVAAVLGLAASPTAANPDSGQIGDERDLSADGVIPMRITLPFTADSGDVAGVPCGLTRGTLEFELGDGPRAASVQGALLDRPTPDEPAPVCGPPDSPPPGSAVDQAADDGRFTLVTFIAEPGDGGVATMVTQKVDNGVLEYSFPLDVGRIFQFSIQICRISISGRGSDTYCGQPTVIDVPFGG